MRMGESCMLIWRDSSSFSFARWGVLTRIEVDGNDGDAIVGQNALHQLGFLGMIEAEIRGSPQADHATCRKRAFRGFVLFYQRDVPCWRGNGDSPFSSPYWPSWHPSTLAWQDRERGKETFRATQKMLNSRNVHCRVIHARKLTQLH